MEYLECALQLAQYRNEKYWDDVERIAMNQLLESQILRIALVEEIPAKNVKPLPKMDPKWMNTDHGAPNSAWAASDPSLAPTTGCRSDREPAPCSAVSVRVRGGSARCLVLRRSGEGGLGYLKGGTRVRVDFYIEITRQDRADRRRGVSNGMARERGGGDVSAWRDIPALPGAESSGRGDAITVH